MDVKNQIVMSQVMMPHHANALGVVHGGEMVKFMDTAAAAVAMRYSKSDCVTAVSYTHLDVYKRQPLYILF